jgi:hypothetical protein
LDGRSLWTVFILWHVRELSEGSDDETLIGVYRTEEDAKAVSERVRAQPGFIDFPDGFEICPYQLNRNGWTEGFVTLG